MVLYKKLTRDEVLEAIAQMIAKTLPERAQGDLDLIYEEDGSISVYFLENNNKEEKSN